MSETSRIYPSDGEDEITTRSTPRSSSSPPASARRPLFLDFPDVTEEACRPFQRITESIYLRKNLGKVSDQDSAMTCDCTQHMVNGVNLACGDDEDCINRSINIECINEDCNCGTDCQNQRFQKRQYANISVIKTENKGYGLRADSDIKEHSFIYEYVGEVITDADYQQRKQDYDEEGIKHFYFMMLQSGQYIDATKKADICRFANHSCNPNCYIDKWIVGTKYRMGLFAKRNIQKGEEITFDYNVDRYGAEAQKCYCGEANCIGFMGGKTQSESARLLPHAITEALGVRASDEKAWIKTQRKNGVKVTTDNVNSKVNVEFVKALDLHPVTKNDVSKITTCLLQPDLDFIVISKVIERIIITSDPEILVRISRLHGIQALGSALKTVLSYAEGRDFTEEEAELVKDIISILDAWPPLKARNTIQTCKIDVYLEEITKKIDDKQTIQKSQSLLENWQKLEVIYRIPKKENGSSNSANVNRSSLEIDERRAQASSSIPSRPVSSKVPWAHINVAALPPQKKVDGVPLPTGWEWATDKRTNVVYYFNREKGTTQWDKPQWPELPVGPKKDSSLIDEEKKRKEAEKEKIRQREAEREMQRIKEIEEQRRKAALEQEELERKRSDELASIILKAKALAETELNSKAKTKSEKKSKSNSKASKSKTDSSNINGHSSVDLPSSSSSDPVKKWHKTFAPVVQEMLKKYQSKISRDDFKECAREIVHTLTDKELKKGNEPSGSSALSSDKKSKVHHFVKYYMEKFIQKKEEKAKRKQSVSHASGSDLKRSKH